MEVQKYNLSTAYKYRDRNEKIISVGMFKEEVIKAWGEPTHIYKPDVKNEYNNYSDEYWIYTKEEENVFRNNDISYEVYFNNNEVTKIIELFWKEKFVNILE